MVDFVERMGEGSAGEKLRKGWGLFCILATDSGEVPPEFMARIIAMNPDVATEEDAERMIAFFRSHLFCFLRASEWNADMTLRFMAVKLIELTLDLFPDSLKLREVAYECIMRANTFYSQRLESSAEHLRVEDCFQMARENPHDNNIQRAFCKQIARYIADRRKKERVVSERMLRLVLQAMRNHPTDDVLLQSCCTTLQVVLRDPAQRKPFVDLEGAGEVLRVIRENMSRHLLVDLSISSLISLMEGGEAFADTLVCRDGIAVLLHVIRHCGDKVTVVRRACKLLSMVTSYPKIVPPQTLLQASLNGLVEILQVMYRFFGDAMLIHDACLIFRNLLKDAKHRRNLVEMGVLPVLIQALYFNPRKQGTQVGLFSLVCECLLLLSLHGPSRRKVLTAGGVSAVLFALRDPSVSDLLLEDRAGRFLMCFSDGFECKASHMALANIAVSGEASSRTEFLGRALTGCLNILRTCSRRPGQEDYPFAQSIVADAVYVLGAIASRDSSLEGLFQKEGGWALLMKMRKDQQVDSKSFLSLLFTMGALLGSFPGVLEDFAKQEDFLPILSDLLASIGLNEDHYFHLLRMLWTLCARDGARKVLSQEEPITRTLVSLARFCSGHLSPRCEAYLCGVVFCLVEENAAVLAPILETGSLKKDLEQCVLGKDDFGIPAEVKEARASLKKYVSSGWAREEERFAGLLQEWKASISKEEIDKLRKSIRDELS